jgi:hypothetical protein
MRHHLETPRIYLHVPEVPQWPKEKEAVVEINVEGCDALIEVSKHG